MSALDRLKKLFGRLLSRKRSPTDQRTDLSRLPLEVQANAMNRHLEPEEREAAVNEFLHEVAGQTPGAPVSYALLEDVEEAARRTGNQSLPVKAQRTYGIIPERDRTIWTAGKGVWPFYNPNNRFVRRSLERVMDAAEREGDVFGPDAPAFGPEYHYLAVPSTRRPTAEAAGFINRSPLDDIIAKIAAATTPPPDGQSGHGDAPAQEPYGAPPGRWRRFRKRLKESTLGPYLAAAGIVGVAALLTLSSTYRSRHRERIEVEALHTLRPVAVQPYRSVSPDTAPVAPAPKKSSAQDEEAPLEHVVEDTFRLKVRGVRTLTIDYEGGQLRYEPEGRAVALPGPLLEYAHAHPDERVVLTAQTGDGELRFTLPLGQLVGQDASDYGANRFKGDVAREHRSDGPTTRSPYHAQQDAPGIHPDTGDAGHRGLRPSGPPPGTLDAQLAGFTLYQQRHRQDSEHGYMTPTEISDHLEDVYGARVGRADFIAARRTLVAELLANDKSLGDIAKELNFSYRTIQRDVQVLRA